MLTSAPHLTAFTKCNPANISPFTSAVPLRLSNISSVPRLNLKPNPRGGAAKKIMSSPYKNILRQLKRKHQAGH
jgi:hypothetical protein